MTCLSRVSMLSPTSHLDSLCVRRRPLSGGGGGGGVSEVGMYDQLTSLCARAVLDSNLHPINPSAGGRGGGGSGGRLWKIQRGRSSDVKKVGEERKYALIHYFTELSSRGQFVSPDSPSTSASVRSTTSKGSSALRCWRPYSSVGLTSIVTVVAPLVHLMLKATRGHYHGITNWCSSPLMELFIALNSPSQTTSLTPHLRGSARPSGKVLNEQDEVVNEVEDEVPHPRPSPHSPTRSSPHSAPSHSFTSISLQSSSSTGVNLTSLLCSSVPSHLTRLTGSDLGAKVTGKEWNEVDEIEM
eukprot:GHVN01007894.1.p1 GENE.GHVN01007894.1~~GHVN01007894.1.p1  ORF type:complete len:299 (-),score=87.70 GHVN01007894.1:179-1075(-)